MIKQVIKLFVLTSVVFLFLVSGIVFAGRVTFIKEYTYHASDLDSKVSSRTIALEQVKRLLLEELGTYLISETEVKNFRLTKDQITTYSAGIVGAEVTEEKWNGVTYYLKARVSADPEGVIGSLKRLVQDKQKTKELEETREKAEEMTKEIERLKKELEIAKAEGKKTDVIQIKQYNETANKLSATDWYQKGLGLALAGNYAEAIETFTKAIQLDPQYARAYYDRGTTHGYLGNYQSAIRDFTRAIELKPNDAWSYGNRGIAYGYLGNYQQAIRDFTKAIELNPNDDYIGQTYHNRAIAYFKAGNNQQGINDLKIAARLGDKPAQDSLRARRIQW